MHFFTQLTTLIVGHNRNVRKGSQQNPIDLKVHFQPFLNTQGNREGKIHETREDGYMHIYEQNGSLSAH